MRAHPDRRAGKGFDESGPPSSRAYKRRCPSPALQSIHSKCSALPSAPLADPCAEAKPHSSPFHGSFSRPARRGGGDDDEEAAAAAGGAVRVAGPGVVDSGGGGAEIQCGVQLRRLDHGHGEPVHERAAVGDHLHAAALRGDLLRVPDVPLLRRARDRGLFEHQVRAALPAPLQVHERRLQEGRQHGHHGRHGHGRALLPLPGAVGQDLEQRAHQLPTPVVPADHLRRLREQLQELPGELAVHLRGVRWQRLQRDAVRELQHGPSQHVHSPDHQHDRRRRGEAAGAGCGRRGGARCAPHRLLPDLPEHLRHLQRRRLRRPGVPEEVQRPVHQPQLAAAGQAVGAAGQVQVGADHVRRLLLRRLRHGPEPQQIRFQLGAGGVLRVGGRQVQLRQQRAVRDERRRRLRQPGLAPQLGRHPPHRGSVQADHRRMAQRGILQTRNTTQLACR